MFDEVTDTPTVARTSNLNEELGQVSQCQCYVVPVYSFISQKFGQINHQCHCRASSLLHLFVD